MVTNHHIAWELAKERQRELLRAGKSRRPDVPAVTSAGESATPSVLSGLWRREARAPTTACNRPHSQPAGEVQGTPGLSGCS